MSNGLPGKRMGFASFFANTDAVAAEAPLPARSPSPSAHATVPFPKTLHSSAVASTGSVAKGRHVYPATQSARTPTRDRLTSGHKSASKKRNYKCIADPLVNKQLPKESKPVFRYDGQCVSDSSIWSLVVQI